MISALIITHGDLGKVMMNQVERTLGPQPQVVVLTNDNLSLEQMNTHVRAHVDSSPVVMFVDFCGGSPFLACRSARDLSPQCALISGINMPMLFSFFTKREKLPFAALVETVQVDGVRGIQVVSEAC